VSKPDQTRRVLIVLTAGFAFFAGVVAAHGNMTLSLVMLGLLALAWLVAAIAHA
jgi:hypothetical protein